MPELKSVRMRFCFFVCGTGCTRRTSPALDVSTKTLCVFMASPQRYGHNLGYADGIATIVSEVGIQGCSIVGINHKTKMRHDRLNGTPVDVWHGILKVCCVVSVDLFCTMWTYHGNLRV